MFDAQDIKEKQECTRYYLTTVSHASELVQGYEAEYEAAQNGNESESILSEINAKKKGPAHLLEVANDAIENVRDERNRDVIRMRYMERLSVPVIARELHYSEHSVHNFCASGLEELYDYIPVDWKCS